MVTNYTMMGFIDGSGVGFGVAPIVGSCGVMYRHHIKFDNQLIVEYPPSVAPPPTPAG